MTLSALRDSSLQPWRRAVFALLAGGSWAAAVSAMATLLAADGMSLLDAAMVLCFALSIPMVVLGFWNALIGAAILLFARNPLAVVAPFAARRAPTRATSRAQGARAQGKTAIVMPVFNEDPDRVFRHLRHVLDSLDLAGQAEGYEVFLLSDSNRPEIVAAEQYGIAQWRREDHRPARLHYRRRDENTGFKAGNLWDFVERWGDGFDYMVVLDADSVMSGARVAEMVGLMDANPRIGILQSLSVGLPAASFFARVFQFGMRQGMLTHTLGAAWWQGDAGPYWGHNAVIRLAPFKAACALPVLPGSPPLGGHILSHDQVEAALMRAHGYEVRVLPEEGGSYEEMPPSLPEFIKRDLRWCQGNMQYLRLLGRRGFRVMGRVQLALAVLMYTAALFWLLFLLLGFGQVLLGDLLPRGGLLSATQAEAVRGPLDNTLAVTGVGLLVVMLGMTFAPKLLGYALTLVQRDRRRSHGGALRVGVGALAETVFSVLLAPVVMIAQSVFIAGLFFGRKVQWNAQTRDTHAVPFTAALGGFWLQAVLGIGGALLLAAKAPAVLPWAAPLLIGLALAPAFTWATAHPLAARVGARLNLCIVPEERHGDAGLPAPRLRQSGRAGGPVVPVQARSSRMD